MLNREYFSSSLWRKKIEKFEEQLQLFNILIKVKYNKYKDNDQALMCLDEIVDNIVASSIFIEDVNKYKNTGMCDIERFELETVELSNIEIFSQEFQTLHSNLNNSMISLANLSQVIVKDTSAA